MKKSLCNLFSAALLLALSSTVASAETLLESTTILKIESRDVSGFKKLDIWPATQFLGLEANKLADGNLSLHLYGWGRVDLFDKSYNNDTIDGSLTYGYLQYRSKNANADLRLGRFFIHEGIINEQVDGLSVQSDLPYGFGITAFGGANVHSRHLFGETSDGKGDGIMGGRLNYRYRGKLELGFSGIYESTAPTLINFSNADHRLLGGDIWFSPHRMITLAGHTSYNTETRTASDHFYQLTVNPVKELVLTAFFNEQRDRSYFYGWSMLSGASLNPSDKSRSIGGSATYTISKLFEVTGDYKHYTRELGAADRFGGDARLNLVGNTIRGGVAYHYLRADNGFALSGTNSASYHELRAYLMLDTKSFFGAVDGIDYIFKDRIYNVKSAWEATGSLGYHITPNLALSGDISYGRNPEFTEELRGLLRLTYTTDFIGKGGSK